MKKLPFLLALLLSLCLMACGAGAQTEGDFTYSISNGKAKITSYTGSAAELTLPDTLGGYPVTAIHYCAFRNCTSLTRITIPDGVTAIGSNAFQNCSSLAEIIIPDSVTRIDTHAFYACSSLKQLSLHDHMDHIHSLAFYGCSAVRYCHPDSLTAIMLTDVGYTFTSPDHPQLALKAYEDDAGRRTFAIADCEESAVSVSFPEHVTAIGKYAFFGCTQLAEIALPDGVTEIAQSAFEGCSALRKITLPGSIEKIAADAFSGCTDITVIAPPGSAGQTFAEASGFSWQAP